MGLFLGFNLNYFHGLVPIIYFLEVINTTFLFLVFCDFPLFIEIIWLNWNFLFLYNFKFFFFLHLRRWNWVLLMLC